MAPKGRAGGPAGVRPADMELRVEPLVSTGGHHHDRNGFSCGVPALDGYLKRQAGQDQQRKVGVCYVAVNPAAAGIDGRARILGYYTLSNYGLRFGELPADMTRRLPRYPMVPAALLGRLAVASESRGTGLGEFLLADALRRTLRVSAEIAIHAVVVDAIDPAAAAFYASYGFRPFPGEHLRLFLPLATLSLAEASPATPTPQKQD